MVGKDEEAVISVRFIGGVDDLCHNLLSEIVVFYKIVVRVH